MRFFYAKNIFLKNRAKSKSDKSGVVKQKSDCKLIAIAFVIIGDIGIVISLPKCRLTESFRAGS